MIDKKLAEALKGLALTQKVTCRCGFSSTVPVLWDDYYCGACGANVMLPQDNARAIARRLVMRLDVHPEHVGLALGDPQALPPAFIRQLRAEAGRNFAFVRLEGAFKFECQHCGKCCKKAISSKNAHLARISPEESLLAFGDSNHSRLPVVASTGACVFLDDKTRCTIHGRRPIMCRLFPLQSFGLELDGQRIRYLAWIPSPCPGVGQGRTWTVHEFLKVSAVLNRFSLESLPSAHFPRDK